MARRLSIALVILLVVGALLSPISPRAVRAATLSVTSTADSGPGSLRDVIASAAPNDTVTFDPTLFSTPQTITLTSPITIAKNLTIQGPGANLVALDGNNAVQIFKLSLADIVLSGLTFQHGYSQVVESTTVLSVYDCVFVDNEGIPISQAVNGKLIVNNSTFTNNHGSYSGGISNNDYSSAIISNSTFTNNSGAYYGGALTNSNDSIMSVSNSTFTGNTVGYYGGAIGNYSNAKLIVNNSTFINNWSLYYGGAIVNVNLSTVNINNSTFSGNNSGNGGAIYSASSQVSINGSTISGNSSPNGGGIHSVISASPLVRLSQTIVANNINGPMSSTPNSPNDIRGSVISDGTNLIGNTIGALGLVSGDLQNVNPMLGPLQNNGGATHTMALSAGSPAIDALSVCPGVVDDQRTTQRPADGDGNSSKLCDIGAYEVNALAGPLSLTVDTANDTNDGTCSGGCSLREAIALIGSGGTIGFTPSLASPISLNSALGELVINKEITITGPGASQLTVSGSNAIRIFNIRAGANLTVNALTLANGSNAVNGGAITNEGALTIDSTALTGNQAPQGGAITNNGILWITSSELSDNTATYYGGALYNNGIALLTNATVAGNSATDSTGSGGGIYSAKGLVYLKYSTVANNSALANGGGIAQIAGRFKLQDTIIADNITGGNCYGRIFNGGYNVHDDPTCFSAAPQYDPQLGPLQNNGGETRTMDIGWNSPALDHALNDRCPVTDQRGVSRPTDGTGDGILRCDTGAYEMPLRAPKLLGPSGTISTSLPLFRWNAVTGATTYEIWVSNSSGTVFQTQYTSGQVCAAAPCSLPAPSKLWNNSYTWTVRAANASGWSAWAGPMFFTVNVNEPPPAAPILRNPSGTITTSLPNFTWTPNTNATGYVLVISNVSGDLFQQSYTASICTSTLCTVVKPIQLWNSPYTFRVQSFNPNGSGPFSSAKSFTVNEAVPAAAVLISPTGTITTNHPTFTWNTAVRATSYTLLVTGPSGEVINTQLSAASVCTGTSCSFTHPSVVLANGHYTWKIQTAGPGGLGPWTAKGFNVNVVGGAPVNPISATPVPTFVPR